MTLTVAPGTHGRGRLAPWVRLVREPSAVPQLQAIHSAADVLRAVRPVLDQEEVESFLLIALNTQHAIAGMTVLTRGLVNSSLVHPREVFRFAIALGATGVIVAHNHPSGQPAPSADDRVVTRQLVEAGRLLDIPVYDHVITGLDGRHFSFAEAGLL